MTISTMSLSVYATADNTVINEKSEDNTAKTNVDMTVNPYYIVTIPTEVTLDGSAKISATVFTKSNDYVKVSLSDTGDFKVTNDDNQSLEYEVKNGETIWTKDSFVSFETDGEATLDFVRKQSNTIYSGEYTGTVTFTVSLENKKV